jgi:hypothetical protein
MAVAAIFLIAKPVSVYANSLEVVATFGNDGSYIGVSCGGSGGNFRFIYFASTNKYVFYNAEPDDCE